MIQSSTHVSLEEQDALARELAEIAARVQTGAEPAESVRSLLRHFGFERGAVTTKFALCDER